jgi:hypothetical protein
MRHAHRTPDAMHSAHFPCMSGYLGAVSHSFSVSVRGWAGAGSPGVRGVGGARFFGLIDSPAVAVGGMLAGVGSLYIAYDRSSAGA